jgi:hypothetical protein
VIGYPWRVIFTGGNQCGRISDVQTVKTVAGVVPLGPKLSVVPMIGVFFIGG